MMKLLARAELYIGWFDVRAVTEAIVLGEGMTSRDRHRNRLLKEQLQSIN